MNWRTRWTAVSYGPLGKYLRFVARRIVEDRCLMVAGSLTYTSLLALVPLFTVTIVLTSHIAIIRDLIFQVKTFALRNLVPDVGGRLVTQYMDQFSQNAGKLTVIGLLIIVGIAVALMFTIDKAFNDIWRTRRRRSWWKRLASYLAVLAVGPVLIGASLTLTSYLVHWSRGLDRLLPFLDDWFLRIVPFVLTSLALVTAYRAMPARHVPIRHALAGGLVAAMLFEIVKHLFVVYVMRMPTYNLVYGTFASVPIFLVWLYCCWMVVLIGAEIAATLSYFRHHEATHARRESRPGVVPQVERIIDALAGSEGGLSLTALRMQAPMPIDVAEDILHALVEAGLVAADKRGRYRLAKPRESIAVGELEVALA